VLKFFASLPPCLIGMEACATAHYWARELTKLGHEVRLMPAKDVKAYVRCETVETVDRKTRFGSREERARAFDWDLSADHIRARSQNGCT
jgi:transposase